MTTTTKQITILCAEEKSIYKMIPGVEVYDKNRNAYEYNGPNMIIAHPPCQQWSRMRHFAKVNQEEKELAWHCLELVNRNGGILEHPMGSLFFKEAGIKNLYSVNQHWFGFPARKSTLLYFSRCKPIAHPLNFDAIKTRVQDLHSSKRSFSTESFALWLIECVRESIK